MTLDVFTGAALTVAAYELMGSDPKLAARELSDRYKNQYDDNNLLEDLIEAKDEIVKWLGNRFQNEHDASSLASTCETLTFAMIKFDQNGKKKRRFFNGSIFRKNQDRIMHKPSRSIEMVTLYDAMIRNGVIKYSSIR